MTKYLAKWLWFQCQENLGGGGAVQANLSGASLETFSGEAQLKKKPSSLKVDEIDPFSKKTQIACQMSAIQIEAIQIIFVHWFRKMLMRFTVENIMSAGKKFKAAKFLSVKIISLRWQTKERAM